MSGESPEEMLPAGQHGPAGKDASLAAEGAGSVAHVDRPLRVLRVEGFEPAVALSDAEQDAYRRRFVTLFADEQHRRRGGLGSVVRAFNAMGEALAVKTLVAPEHGELEGEDAYDSRAEALKAAFRREYEDHRLLSGLRGFPRLYGFGAVDGVPAIVMEWVEGETLDRIRRELAVDDEGRLSPLAVAGIGRELFDLLARMELVGDGVVHRDVSPANVMMRTSRLGAREQAEEGSFDLCLIDFGSAAPAAPAASSLTDSGGPVRRATVAYAPPEMLSDDVPNVARLRKSHAVDVYEAASVLYELAYGRPPFDLDAPAGDGEPALSPYRVKCDRRPLPAFGAHAAGCSLVDVLLREPDVAVAAGKAAMDLGVEPDSDGLRRALALVDEQIADMLLPCLDPDQRRRPTAEAMRDGMEAFARNYAANVDRALRGAPLIPCAGSASWLAAASPFALRRLVRTFGKAISAGVWAVVVASSALLLDGAHASLFLGPLSWQGEVNGLVLAAALALPGAAGLLARGTGPATAAGFVRGTAALASASVVALAAASCLAFDPVTRVQGLYAALFASSAAAWCPIVLDYAMTVVPALMAEARRRLPRADGAAAGIDAPQDGPGLEEPDCSALPGQCDPKEA